MTRFPSFGRFFKRSLAICALLFSPTAAESSQYDMRMHRSFIKRVADSNFDAILGHLQEKFVTELPLKHLDADVRQLHMRI